jgi:hypothetical protein
LLWEDRQAVLWIGEYVLIEKVDRLTVYEVIHAGPCLLSQFVLFLRVLRWAFYGTDYLVFRGMALIFVNAGMGDFASGIQPHFSHIDIF